MRVISTIAYASAFAYAACVLSVAVAQGSTPAAHVQHVKVVSVSR